MKRVKKAFASGARVYPAGAELPDNHPAVKASPGLFESVAAPAKPPRKGKGKPKADDKSDEQKDNGQGPKDDGDDQGDGDADGET